MFSWSSHIKEHWARARPSQPDGTPERGKPTTAGHPRIYQTLTKQDGLGRQIAAELFVSVNTVKTQLGSIYRKLGVTERNEAIARAEQLGLL